MDGTMDTIHNTITTYVWNPAVSAGPVGDFLMAFSDYREGPGSSGDIFGLLWGNRSFLPVVRK